MTKIFRSVRFKLLFAALVAVFVTNITVMLLNLHETGKLMVSQQKEEAAVMSDMIDKSIAILMIQNRWNDLQNLIQGFPHEIPTLSELRIFQPGSGRIIASSDREEVGRVIYEKDWTRFKNGEFGPFVVKKEGTAFASRVSPISNRPACHRCHGSERDVLGVLDIEVSLAGAEAMINEIATKHFAAMIVGFGVITIVFLIGGARLINRPLRDLMSVMEEVGKGNLSIRVEEKRNDEFGYLAKGFNSMVGSLEMYQLKQMEKAAKMVSLGEIMSGIAHEVKNPLTGISCAIQVLNAELSDGGRQKDIITEVLTQIKRLDRTVKDLLSFARPKPPNFVPSKIAEVVEKSVFLVYSEAKRENVVIEIDVPEDLPEVMLDPDQMQQVLLNLMINSVQAMQGGGKLTVSASVKSAATLPEAMQPALEGRDTLVVTVRDTGKGIRAEDLDIVFEPFFTRKTKGTGLGLSISQKIVQEHGGKLAVVSELGKGTEFAVYLPLGGGAAAISADEETRAAGEQA